MTHFIIRSFKLKVTFLLDIKDLATTKFRIYWYKCIPYVIVNSKIYDCQQGVERHKAGKERTALKKVTHIAYGLMVINILLTLDHTKEDKLIKHNR